jgi:hypothetical protein
MHAAGTGIVNGIAIGPELGRMGLNVQISSHMVGISSITIIGTALLLN